MESENNKYDVRSRYSVESTDSSGSSVVLRNKSRFSNVWNPVDLSSRFSRKNCISISGSIPSRESFDTSSYKEKDTKNTVVTIVLVEARDLPNPPEDGSTHGLYCKIRLGTKSNKSKMATNIYKPEWNERYQIPLREDHLLNVSVWDKGKQKNFMGSCIVDLSGLTKDYTYDIWQPLDNGYGSIHLTVTMCNVRNNVTTYESDQESYFAKQKYAIHNLTSDWSVIGQLHIKVICAKGLSGKSNAYCTLEVDNQRVQTHTARNGAEPSWDKTYIFNVYDISSTLDLKVYDKNQIQSESLGRVSIPLLRISDRTVQWYALKDRTKRQGAKGNCPRVLLDMSLFWNPVKAAVRLFQPKEVKYLRKPSKFDLGLVIRNMEFMRCLFQGLQDVNESFKRLFEWENQQLSFVALLGWLFFWYNMTLWGLTLLLLLPFLYYWANQQNINEKSFRNVYKQHIGKENIEKDEGKVLTLEKIQGFPELTLNITGTVEYMVSLLERIYNLASFKVPYLSYLAMFYLMLLSLALYLVPFNYLLMALGVYKFTRKYLNPSRQLNNDLLDFISRVPDSEILNDWKELNVPEPIILSKNSQPKVLGSRSYSVM